MTDPKKEDIEQPYDWMDEARQAAAQCWCEEETSDRVMDPILAESVARRIAAWMQTGAFHASNESYWRDRAHAAESALAQAATDRLDARRYRWLRADRHTLMGCAFYRDEELDALIDAALTGTEK